METKYFHAENAGRLLGGVRFTIYSQSAGTLWGVHATQLESEIKSLSSMSSDKSSGVTAIDQSEYEQALKKKTYNSDDLPPLSRPSPAAAPIKGTQGAQVVYDPRPVEEKSEVASGDKPLESVEAAIKVEEVKGRNP